MASLVTDILEDLRGIRNMLMVVLAVLGITMPGAVVTAAIDRLVRLDTGQLWTFSIVLSFVVLALLCAAAALIRREEPVVDGILCYGGLVAVLLLAIPTLYFAAEMSGIGRFTARFFARGIFTDDHVDNALSIIVTSCMTLAGTLVVAGTKAVSAAPSAPQIWLLGLPVYVLAGFAIGRFGRWRRWSLIADSQPDTFGETVAGMYLFAMANVAAMLAGCVGYFGFKLELLREVFERFNVSS